MRHAALKQRCTLAGGFDGADCGRRAMIPGTYQPAKMDQIYWMPGYLVGDVAVIDLPSRFSKSGTFIKHYISLDICRRIQRGSWVSTQYILPSMKTGSSSVTGQSFIGTLRRQSQVIY